MKHFMQKCSFIQNDHNTTTATAAIISIFHINHESYDYLYMKGITYSESIITVSAVLLSSPQLKRRVTIGFTSPIRPETQLQVNADVTLHLF